jgi:hypothetical protein
MTGILWCITVAPTVVYPIVCEVSFGFRVLTGPMSPVTAHHMLEKASVWSLPARYEEVWKESQKLCGGKERSEDLYSNPLDVVNV